MTASKQARAAHVLTLRDILSAFPMALARLPSSQEVHKVQRAVTVLERALIELGEKMT